ncbi:YutD-like domain-containing protein [Bacillus altitudinis]|uniref:YutD-like domain-containing protein n=1 Tax=Bacillus altitudinis TaxID=293387 RepID=UPI003B52A7AD
MLNKCHYILTHSRYNHLTLNPFFHHQNQNPTFHTKITTLHQYIYQYSNFPSPYFLLNPITK